VEEREREDPKLLLNQGPSEPCYATASILVFFFVFVFLFLFFVFCFCFLFCFLIWGSGTSV